MFYSEKFLTDDEEYSEQIKLNEQGWGDKQKQ